MNPIATGVAGALISGVAMYTVGTAAAQVEPTTQNAALVQTVDGQFVPASYATALRPVAAPSSAKATPVNNSRRASAPARRVPQRVVTNDEREYVREEEEIRSDDRSWGKTAMVIGGSAASGAGVGGIVGGKKGALIGAAIGGGAASIYEATRRR